MKFYIYLCLLLATFVSAKDGVQDDNPTGHEVGVTPIRNPTDTVDDNPSPSANTTVSSTNTPSPRSEDNSLKSYAMKNALNGIYVLTMMFMM